MADFVEEAEKEETEEAMSSLHICSSSSDITEHAHHDSEVMDSACPNETATSFKDSVASDSVILETKSEETMSENFVDNVDPSLSESGAIECGLTDPEDDTSRAAVALAAVAAAATANNSSPSAAAEAARALAPGIAPEASIAAFPGKQIARSARKHDVEEVKSSTVKYFMLSRLEGNVVTEREKWSGSCHSIYLSAPQSRNDRLGGTQLCQKLAKGDNDSFLHYLLILSYFRGTDEEGYDCSRSSGLSARIETREESDSAGNAHKKKDREFPVNESNDKEDEERASRASDIVCGMVLMIQDAYELLHSPRFPLRGQKGEQSAGLERETTVTLDAPASHGDRDATVEFFWACSGGSSESKADDQPREGSLDESVADRDLRKPSEDPPLNASKPPASRKSSSGVQETASSVLSSVFSSVKRGSKSSPGRQSTLGGVFRKRSRLQLVPSAGKKNGRAFESSEDPNREEEKSSGEYTVQIDREMLGLTVENVLERTVVRTVLPGGAAKKAGAQVGSLIVRVGNVETKNLTHFETIDELRQSQRPLKLVLRQISVDALRAAREEMGRLIRGGGFGICPTEDHPNDRYDDRSRGNTPERTRAVEGSVPKVGGFSESLHSRWSSFFEGKGNPKDASIAKAGEKLVWILTMLVAGLERESINIASIETNGDDPEDNGCNTDGPPFRQKNVETDQKHSAKECTDAAKSVSKVLYDFVREKLDPPINNHETGGSKEDSEACIDPSYTPRRGRKVPSLPSVAGGANRSSGRSPLGRSTPATHAQPSTISLIPENITKPLLRIGDVLHRTRTFLADPTSPPAALLRGEIIAFLCDVLDIDTEMELSEEEAASSIAGHKSGPINDLGSAGSLLKLIVLNCSTVYDLKPTGTPSGERSFGSDNTLDDDRGMGSGLQHWYTGFDLYSCHAGNRFMAVVHRLAASRSTSARVTACSLGPVLWGHLDFPHQLQLRGVITRALHDAEVIVRKSTATVLHEIAELVFDSRAVPWLVLMCERVMTDPEPQLRAAAMTLTWHLAEHLPNAFLGDASKGSRSLRRLPPRSDPTFSEVYLLQCKLLPVATRLADDRAPSVRLAVAAQCDRLCNALGEHWSSVIIDLLQALLADTDERVRSEAILCVPRLVETVLVSSSPDATPTGGVGVLEALLPVSIKLIADPSAVVRVSLATSAGELLTLLVGLESLEEISSPSSSDAATSIVAETVVGYRQHKKHVDETLIPLVQKLLHDPDPEVTSSALRAVTNASRGNVREIRTRRNSTASEDDTVSLSSYHSHTSAEKKEPVFIPVLSETQVLRLLPTLSDLANSPQWRVRQSAVEIVPALLGCTHRLQTRSEIAQLCVRLMGDTVDAVRRTAAECLCLGGGSLGSLGEDSSGEWISAIVLPHVRKCSESLDSKQRMLSLKMVEVVLLNGVCPSSTSVVSDEAGEHGCCGSPLHELVEVATSLTKDRTVNVRLNVGRVIGNIIHVFEEDQLLFIIEALLEQIEKEKSRDGGGDRDVLYFAKRAICRAQVRLEEVAFTGQENTNSFS